MRYWTCALVIALSCLSPSPSAAQSAAADPPLEELRARAQERMQKDAATFSTEQLRDIESRYQPANRNLGAPGVRDALLGLVRDYPAANRAGCAVLYLAQLSGGAEREAFLQTAIADHGDAWYGDGTQVGAFARAQLAVLYANTNRLAEAKAMAEEVVRLFPGAVTHDGTRIADGLRRLKLLP